MRHHNDYEMHEKFDTDLNPKLTFWFKVFVGIGYAVTGIFIIWRQLS